MMLRQEDVFQPTSTQGHVLCCLCGAGILPNSSNMCVNCLRTQVDITEGMQKQATVLWCKDCGRYLQPPKHWLHAEPESKELLTFCLKKLKGLQKVKLVDAGFIWTEPHSRRLKVKVTVQAEVFNGAILQQAFVVEYIIETHMCPDCEKQNSNPNTWIAAVQVRQHTEHKRTFLYLEQLILKHNADANCVSIKNIHEGIDFYFGNRSHAQKMVDFLQSVIPVRFRQDKQLVSHNIHTSSYNYKYTYSVEIVPICRDDLICLPAKLAAGYGNIGPVVLCTRVTNVLTLVDPITLRTINMDAGTFFHDPLRPMMNSKQLREYVVLDIEPVGTSTNRLALADVQVARTSDFGKNDRILSARTHLGHLLHVGDTVLGYDLLTAQLVSPEMDKALEKGFSLPDVILVRKSYEARRKRRKERGQQRSWKLKSMQAEVADEPVVKGRGRHGKDAGVNRDEIDRERFMQELEEDPELRSKIAIYKDPDYVHHDAMTDGDEEEVPEIPLEELLDDLTALQIAEDGQMTN